MPKELTEDDKMVISRIQTDLAGLCNWLGKVRSAGTYIQVDQKKLKSTLVLTQWELDTLSSIFRLGDVE